MPGLLKTERTAACFDNFPQERRGGDSIDVVFNQQQTHLPAKGVAICMRTWREIKRRFGHAFLPHGAWVHAAAEGLLVLFLHLLGASPFAPRRGTHPGRYQGTDTQSLHIGLLQYRVNPAER
jgi:hypothetical protein